MRYILIFLALGLCACTSQKDAKSYTTQNKDMWNEFIEISGITEKKTDIIKSQDAFAEMYKEAYVNYYPPKEAPTIDFENSSVVMITFGEISHGGISYTYKSSTKKGDTVHVILETPYRDFDQPVTTVMTAPLFFIEIPKTTATKVTYEIQTLQKDE